MRDNRHFYRNIKQLEKFSEAVEANLHQALPHDWWVVVADVADSTSAIAVGDYKKVNKVGGCLHRCGSECRQRNQHPIRVWW